MTYNKTVWVDNQTEVDAKNLNNIEAGIETLDISLEDIETAVASLIIVTENTAAGLLGKANESHVHAESDAKILALETADIETEKRLATVEETLTNNPGGDVSGLEAEVASLKSTVEALTLRIATLESQITTNGEGHTHADINAAIASLEADKAETTHTHNSSDIITKRKA